MPASFRSAAIFGKITLCTRLHFLFVHDYIVARVLDQFYFFRSLVQAQYWNDPLNQEEYKKASIFLADINNENVGSIANTRKCIGLPKLQPYVKMSKNVCYHQRCMLPSDIYMYVSIKDVYYRRMLY